MPRAPTVCLNMIVKNEAHVIARCLASVRPIVSSWLIVDTGSTDGTQDLIREAMKGTPGELVERPWRDFGHNRTEAIELARARRGKDAADYLLVIDADDVLLVPDRFTMPALTADSYALRVEDAGSSYWRTHLFRPELDFRYVGVLHEVLTSERAKPSERLESLVYRRHVDGARSADPDKYLRDAGVLEAALVKEPDNARYAYYLAQSWRDAKELEKARVAYEKRALMGGWVEEVWSSLHEAAKLAERLERDDDAVIGAFLRAFENRPSRAESPCDLAAFLRRRGRSAAAYPFARVASDTPRPGDILFLDDSVYAWRALDELAVSAYWAGRYREALQANQRLLSGSALPAGERERVQKNMAFCREKIDAARGGKKR